MKALSLLALATSALAIPSPKSIKHRGDEYPFFHHAYDPSIVPHPHALDDFSREAYDSGRVHMSMMAMFSQSIKDMQFLGIFDDPVIHIPITKYTPCVDGHAGTEANSTFSCNGLDLYYFAPHNILGDVFGNDIWGWSYVDGEATREFGLVGQSAGTAFVEIVGEGQVIYLGRLPTQSVESIWRDIKVIGNHAYIGSEALDHGVQVFDLTKLLDRSLASRPREFNIATDLTAHYSSLPVGSSHNIVSHASKNLIIAVGAMPRNDSCASGLIFIDVTDPSKPVNAGCAAQDGYVHDAQCLTYFGPHEFYNGTDICYAFNEDSFTIYDITTPSKPIVISRTDYYGVAYSHQGWVVDEKDQRYLLLDDELDEMGKTGWANDTRTVTYIWDIQNLTEPILTGHYKSPAKAIDHNLYVHEGLAYESNYGSGLRVVDVSSVTTDPTGGHFKEIAFFDVHPEDDDVGGIAEFSGSWSVYPFFTSGYILVNSIERGLFVVKMTV